MIVYGQLYAKVDHRRALTTNQPEMVGFLMAKKSPPKGEDWLRLTGEGMKEDADNKVAGDEGNKGGKKQGENKRVDTYEVIFLLNVKDAKDGKKTIDNDACVVGEIGEST